MEKHKAKVKIWAIATVICNDKDEPHEIEDVDEIDDFEIIDYIT